MKKKNMYWQYRSNLPTKGVSLQSLNDSFLKDSRAQRQALASPRDRFASLSLSLSVLRLGADILSCAMISQTIRTLLLAVPARISFIPIGLIIIIYACCREFVGNHPCPFKLTFLFAALVLYCFTQMHLALFFILTTKMDYCRS